MGNSYDGDCIRRDVVDYGIREAPDQHSPKSAVAGCARFRGMTRTLEAPANLLKECLTKTWHSCFAEQSRGR